jgi:hypothetical protein
LEPVSGEALPRRFEDLLTPRGTTFGGDSRHPILQTCVASAGFSEHRSNERSLILGRSAVAPPVVLAAASVTHELVDFFDYSSGENVAPCET